MSATTTATRSASAPLAILSYGFRPFFLLSGLTAALAVPAWLAMLTLGIEPAGPFDALRWHVHEMIFGYLAAAMTGFALTAVPNWTGRLPVRGRPLAALVALWLAGRVAALGVPQPVIALALDGAFLVVVAAMLWREIAAGRNWRNLPVALLFTLFAGANIAFHLADSTLLPDGLGRHGALAVATVLICLIGGRIIPSFTRNWMVKAGQSRLPAPFGRFDKLTVGVTAVTMGTWAVLPEAAATGALLLVAGALNMVRLARWRGHATLRAPIVTVLHLGYLWIVVALVLLSAAILWPGAVTGSAGLHALTAGSIGTMTLAVMTRATLGHTGHAIHAAPGTVAIYGLVTAGAVLRVAASFAPGMYQELLVAGGGLWSGAFALFVLIYGPIVARPAATRT